MWSSISFTHPHLSTLLCFFFIWFCLRFFVCLILICLLCCFADCSSLGRLPHLNFIFRFQFIFGVVYANLVFGCDFFNIMYAIYCSPLLSVLVAYLCECFFKRICWIDTHFSVHRRWPLYLLYNRLTGERKQQQKLNKISPIQLRVFFLAILYLTERNVWSLWSPIWVFISCHVVGVGLVTVEILKYSANQISLCAAFFFNILTNWRLCLSIGKKKKKRASSTHKYLTDWHLGQQMFQLILGIQPFIDVCTLVPNQIAHHLPETNYNYLN